MQGRVVGKTSAIDTSRSLGDFDFKLPENQAKADFISSSPYLFLSSSTSSLGSLIAFYNCYLIISRYVPEPIPLTKECKFMVIASDGLWNQMDERTVINNVDSLWHNGLSPSEIAGIFFHYYFN